MDFEKIYVNAGEIIISHKPSILWTDLGSCVSVIFHHPELKLSIFTHIVLPDKPFDNCLTVCTQTCFFNLDDKKYFKYLPCVFRFIMRYLNKYNINFRELKVSLYGGSDLFNFSYAVGKRNVEATLNLLKSNKFVISKMDTEGNASRRISHNSFSGETEIIKLNKKYI